MSTKCFFMLVALAKFYRSSLRQYNYGGIQARDQGTSSTNVATLSDGSSHDDLQVDIVSSWNIADCLPKATQVSCFLHRSCVWKSREIMAVLIFLKHVQYFNGEINFVHPYGLGNYSDNSYLT